MPPIQLPPQPPGLDLPAQPHDPPTLADVVAAKSYQTGVDVAVATQTPNGPNENDAARADVFKTSVIIAHSADAVAPAWFQPAMNNILAPIRTTVAQIRNHQLHDGNFSHFTIVPFVDGSMPTQNPHNLPPLINVAAIRTLTGAQTNSYAAGYGLPVLGGLATRRAAIGRAIGCSVPIN